MRLGFCAVCGATEGLEHHHFKPLGDGGIDEPANILTLCGPHHGDVHNMRRVGDVRKLTREALARRKAAGVKLGSPNPRAGGEATRLRWARLKEVPK